MTASATASIGFRPLRTLSTILAALLSCLLAAASADARQITDSAGRKVEVRDTIRRVFAAGPPAAILLYMLAPDRMTGWPARSRPSDQRFIAEPYRNLPALGRLTGRGGTANLESVLSIKPDLILDFGSVRDTYISLADNVQAQTRIPYLLIDGRFEATPAALRLLGEALGVKDIAEKQARYVEATFSEIDKVLADTPPAQRPRVYLARGPDGLETGLTGSINTEIIERAGGRNIADGGGSRRGIARISIEQVIAANPDTILTWDLTFFGKVWTDPLWANVDAVKRKRIYLSPTAPFGWIDRPPSVNRIIGLRWVAQVLYPQRFKQDMRQTTREFYRLFYHVDLTDADLDGLISWSKGQAPAGIKRR